LRRSKWRIQTTIKVKRPRKSRVVEWEPRNGMRERERERERERKADAQGSNV
jgi:hypothetical protein